eukprot:351955-Chlamydomonas_euryale.AAC.10
MLKRLACWRTTRATRCRIHHVAYVDSLKPRAGSNRSIACSRPPMPSCARSDIGTPMPVKRFAMDNTNRRLKPTSTDLACRPTERRSLNAAALPTLVARASSSAVGSRPMSARSCSRTCSSDRYSLTT